MDKKKLKISRIVIVEGRYDKNKLSQILDAQIYDVGGFGIFKDRELLDSLKNLTSKFGAVILTDSDSAGFLIRRRLSDALAGLDVVHAYIPDTEGKEPRKKTPGREFLLGVEGIADEVLINALNACGATDNSPAPSDSAPIETARKITQADLYDLGYIGSPGAAERREALAASLDLPRRIGTNALLRAINAFGCKLNKNEKQLLKTE